jgi:hypothetical protein
VVCATTSIASRPDAPILGRNGGVDYVDPIDRLFGELVGEGITPDQLESTLASVGERDEFEVDRDRELSLLFRGYLGALESVEARDPRARLVDCVRAVAADADALARKLGGRRAIRLYGLADLRGGWRPLLRALASSPALDEVAAYTSVDLPLEELNPVREELDEPDSIAANSTRSSQNLHAARSRVTCTGRGSRNRSYRRRTDMVLEYRERWARTSMQRALVLAAIISPHGEPNVPKYLGECCESPTAWESGSCSTIADGSQNPELSRYEEGDVLTSFIHTRASAANPSEHVRVA